MNDKNNDTPENGAAEAPQEVSKKPTPPLPPPPGEEPPAPPPVERAPLPEYEPGPSPPKSPGLAAFLGVICPGAGYLYVWAYERAFMLWAAIALSIFMIIEGLWGFSFVIAFAYFFSIFDAFREAQFYNARAEGDELPKTRPDGQGRLMFGVFMVVVAAVFLADKYLRVVAGAGLSARRVFHHRRGSRQDEGSGEGTQRRRDRPVLNIRTVNRIQTTPVVTPGFFIGP
jgi:hypothetical protein